MSQKVHRSKPQITMIDDAIARLVALTSNEDSDKKPHPSHTTLTAAINLPPCPWEDCNEKMVPSSQARAFRKAAMDRAMELVEAAKRQSRSIFKTFHPLKRLPIKLQSLVWDRAIHDLAPRIGFSSPTTSLVSYHALFHEVTPFEHHHQGGWRKFALLHIDHVVVSRNVVLRYMKNQRGWSPFGMELASKLCSRERLTSGKEVCYAMRTWHPKRMGREGVKTAWMMVIEDSGIENWRWEVEQRNNGRDERFVMVEEIFDKETDDDYANGDDLNDLIVDGEEGLDVNRERKTYANDARDLARLAMLKARSRSYLLYGR